MQHPRAELQYAKLFRRYDRDRNGTLEWGEFKTAIRKGVKVSHKEVDDGALRSVFDAAAVQQQGHMSVREFADWVRRRRADTHSTRWQ